MKVFVKYKVFGYRNPSEGARYSSNDSIIFEVTTLGEDTIENLEDRIKEIWDKKKGLVPIQSVLIEDFKILK